MTDAITDQLFDSTNDEEVGGLFDSEDRPPENAFKEDAKPPPNRKAARSSGEGLLGTAIVSAGYLLVSKDIDPPVGRCLQLEAPLAAQQIDRAIAHTWLDKLLQPLFRKSDDLEGLGAVFALPIVVGLYERKPQWASILEPAMEELVGSTLDLVAPLMRAQKSKRRRSARSMTDINEAFDIPRGADPVKYILGGWIFQDSQNPEAPIVDDEKQPTI